MFVPALWPKSAIFETLTLFLKPKTVRIFAPKILSNKNKINYEEKTSINDGHNALVWIV